PRYSKIHCLCLVCRSPGQEDAGRSSKSRYRTRPTWKGLRVLQQIEVGFCPAPNTAIRGASDEGRTRHRFSAPDERDFISFIEPKEAKLEGGQSEPTGQLRAYPFTRKAMGSLAVSHRLDIGRASIGDDSRGPHGGIVPPLKSQESRGSPRVFRVTHRSVRRLS